MNRLQTKTGGVIISVILGLGLSTLFAKSCGKNCTVISPIDPKKIMNKSFKMNRFTNDSSAEKTDQDPFLLKNGDGKCVKFVPEYTKCK